MPDSKNKKPELPKKVDTTLADNMRMVLEKHRRQNNQLQPTKEGSKKSRSKDPINMGSPLYGKISSACKAAAKRKFKVWPSAYASGWGVRCTKAGGPSNFGSKKK
jgi:hypothetical protein